MADMLNPMDAREYAYAIMANRDAIEDGDPLVLARFNITVAQMTNNLVGISTSLFFPDVIRLAVASYSGDMTSQRGHIQVVRRGMIQRASAIRSYWASQEYWANPENWINQADVPVSFNTCLAIIHYAHALINDMPVAGA